MALSALPQQPGTSGVGATEGLRGEIVQIDGRMLVSPGSDAQGRVWLPQADEQAVHFAGGRVQVWQDVAVPRDMDQAALEGVVSHPGKRLHVHFADPGVTVSGHVDRYSAAAGAVLKLPVG